MRRSTQLKTVLPVSLLLENKPCLVVGCGKVAARKTKLLLDARAAITVVGPEAGEEVLRLAAAQLIRHVPREFIDSDLDGVVLVFCATNDKVVNRHILKVCNERRILCCSVDGNWTEGDFITPAVFRDDLLTVSVSSGGRSCRRSRLVKDNLARHIALVETADLVVIGTSHHQLPIQRREPLHLVGDRLEQTGRMLMHVWGIHEFMLLNTCNRIELLAIVAKDAGIEELLVRIMSFLTLKEEDYYVKRGFEAFEHVAAVSAGLLSQSPGESHIVAQAKEALDHAAKRGWAGGMMQEWIGAALHVSKDIRHVTRPLLGDLEIEDLCTHYLKSSFTHLNTKRIMVLGTGRVGSGLVERLLATGSECEWCYHVNKPDLAASRAKHVKLSRFDDFPSVLPGADIIVCTAASPTHILHLGHATFFGPTKEVLIVDLAIPRNVEPALDGMRPGIKVVDLDGLKRWYQQEMLDMARVLELSRQVVGEHRDSYEKIVHSFQGGNPGE